MAVNAERNRFLLAAYESGRTVEELSREFGLSVGTVGSLLTQERHKRRDSPEPLYRALRGETEPGEPG